MKITRLSPVSGTNNTMNLDITEEQISAWQSGEYAQIAFPNLTDSEREFLISGITEAEWQDIFREDD